ncbi:CRISPR-associated protein, Cse3 family (plasmid) [Euzebya pacifica]|uniref:CRISPR-associated protein, Cse3 family n=1 Tax=Euzebya pacifica TaxID=1608957 RepID=A0A346Y610_9ACTN|nr:type I-E CRISPR-associated protein Cas6/Cse3/CasE [Euzebya pacifica]AXV09907.1 CRISPR-associated protein, Cse3 family [Euzebya pacifica]
MTHLTTTPMTHPAFAQARWHDARWTHKAVMGLFPTPLPDNGTGPRATSRILYRTEPDVAGGRILIQSDIPPVVDGVRTRPMDDVFVRYRPGGTVALLLHANTVRTINRTRDDGNVRTHRARVPDTLLNGWLKDRLEGAATLHGHIDTSPLERALGPRRRGRQQIITIYRATATITNPTRLIDLCTAGIGRNKAYGCGLLTALPTN